MYIYWWIQNDLDCLGEVIQFTDPGLIRNLQQWVHKNMAALILAEDLFPTESFGVSLN